MNWDDASISAWRKKKEIFPSILVLASPGSHVRFLALTLMLASLRRMCEAAFRVYRLTHTCTYLDHEEQFDTVFLKCNIHF